MKIYPKIGNIRIASKKDLTKCKNVYPDFGTFPYLYMEKFPSPGSGYTYGKHIPGTYVENKPKPVSKQENQVNVAKIFLRVTSC